MDSISPNVPPNSTIQISGVSFFDTPNLATGAFATLKIHSWIASTRQFFETTLKTNKITQQHF
jgi:hypothetical protein